MRKIIIILLTIIVGVLGVTEKICAQDSHQLTGKVLSSIGGQPIKQASVRVVGKPGIETETNDNGLFQLELTDGDVVMEIWHPGFKRELFKLKERNNVRIYLNPESMKTIEDEVPLYKRTTVLKNNTSPVSLLTEDDINLAYTSFEENLQGKVTGLRVNNRSGMTGEGAMITSRGIPSLNLNSAPIIIIDGMIYQNTGYSSPIIDGFYSNPLQDIIPGDIDKITYLKGSETTLLGSMGGNDVLVVTTKRSKKLKTEINFSTYGGVSCLPRKLPMLNSTDFVDLATSVAQSAMSVGEIQEKFPFLLDDPQYIKYATYNNETDWQDDIYQLASQQNFFTSIKGGDAIANYYMSVGYDNKKGILDNTDYQRYSSRVNADIKISQKITANASVGFVYKVNNLANTGLEKGSNPVYATLAKSPMLAAVEKGIDGTSLGRWDPVREFGVSNPVALLADQDVNDKSMNFLGNLGATYRINKWLKANGQIGINYLQNRQNVFIPGRTLGTTVPLSDGEALNSVRHLVAKNNNLYLDGGLTFEKTYNQKNNLFVNAGIRLISNSWEYDFGTGMNTASDDYRGLGQVSKSNPRQISGQFNDLRLMSEYLQVAYNYDERYFLSTNMAVEASSAYGDNVSKSLFFPAVNAAWLISSESFMERQNLLKLLKLRWDLGYSGNGFIPSKASKYYYQTKVYRDLSGIVRSNIPNEDLKLEKVLKHNIGLDLVTQRERLAITLDYFDNKVSDLILNLPVSPIFGYDEFMQNIGKMENSGYELGIKLRLIDRPFKWTVYGNISTYQNKITELGSFDRILTNIPGGQLITRLNSPAYQFWGYETNGVFSTSEDANQAALVNPAGIAFGAGDVRFVDRNDDHIINAEDMTVIGDPNPEYTGGFGTSLAYKGFELSANFTYSYGNDVYNYQRRELESMKNFANQTQAVKNRWRYEGQTATIPKAVMGDPMENSRFSDRWIEDGSYLRLKEARLAYNLPESILLKSGVLYVSGMNLLTFTKYLGYDPEFSYGNEVTNVGVDYGRIPLPKTVVVGLKVGL